MAEGRGRFVGSTWPAGVRFRYASLLGGGFGGPDFPMAKLVGVFRKVLVGRKNGRLTFNSYHHKHPTVFDVFRSSKYPIVLISVQISRQ